MIDASFDSDSGISDTINDDINTMKTKGFTYFASMHFMVHSSIKYWAGNIAWSMTNASNPFSAKCADMAITSYYDSTHTPTSYLIICPYEGKMNTGYNIVNVAPKLTIEKWTWPDYYGNSVRIGAHLRYMWTDKIGNLLAYLAEAK